MSFWLGANRSANSDVDKNLWNIGRPGVWLSATKVSSASTDFTLRTSVTDTVSDGAATPRSMAWNACGLSGDALTGEAPSDARPTRADERASVRRNIDIQSSKSSLSKYNAKCVEQW